MQRVNIEVDNLLFNTVIEWYLVYCIVPGEFLNVNTGRTLCTCHASKSVSNDTKHHFLYNNTLYIRYELEIKFPFKRNGLPCFENAKTFPLHGLTDNNNAVTSPSMYRMKTFR